MTDTHLAAVIGELAGSTNAESVSGHTCSGKYCTVTATGSALVLSGLASCSSS